jgi:hypothetical protein
VKTCSGVSPVSFFVASIEEGFVALDEVAGFRYISSNGCQM